MLGPQPIGNRLERRALCCDGRENRLVLDRVVDVDDLAVLTAEVAEPPVVGDHGETCSLVGDGGRGGIPLGGPLDQPAERLHVVAQMIVHHPQMEAWRTLRLGQPFELNRSGARGVVKELDIFKHPAQMGRGPVGVN